MKSWFPSAIQQQIMTPRWLHESRSTHVTHLYNAMPPFAHRNPGVIGAAFDDPECRMELICDGYHIHGAVVRATFSMMGSERMVLISDSMMATGMPNGTYSLGDRLSG